MAGMPYSAVCMGYTTGKYSAQCGTQQEIISLQNSLDSTVCHTSRIMIPHCWIQFRLIFQQWDRVADPVHYRPDPAPDPVNQNFKTGSRILLSLKESIQTSKFFSHQTYFFWYFEWWLFLSEKMEKFTWKCVKPRFCKIFFPCLYNFTLPKYR